MILIFLQGKNRLLLPLGVKYFQQTKEPHLVLVMTIMIEP